MAYRLRPAALAAVMVLASTGAAAQTPDTLVRRQQRTIDSLAAALRALHARLDSLAAARDTTPDELAAIRAAAAAAAGDTALAANQPRPQRLSLSALNPEISATGVIHASAVRPGPQTESFDAREFEFSFQSALDPYSNTKIFPAFEDGEFDIEEGYLYWSGLPGSTRLDIGKFRQQVGELNRWHLHAVPTGEYPLVLRTFAGEEGLTGTGASLYVPLPFSGRAGAYELYAQATRGANEVLFAGGDRVSWLGQLSAFWQFSRSTYAQLSVSGVYGTNPDTSLKTALGVLAARFSWRPPAEALYRDFTVRGELWTLRRRFAGVGPTRMGGYVDASWKLNRRWILGVRGDYVESPDPAAGGHEWELAPSLTFWQSEFVYLRGVWIRRRDLAAATSDRFTVQVVWAVGPHKHELF
jgi:hypothetical protein